MKKLGNVLMTPVYMLAVVIVCMEGAFRLLRLVWRDRHKR